MNGLCWNIAYMIITVFEIYLYYWLMSGVFEWKRHNKIISVLPIAVFSLIVCGINVINMNVFLKVFVVLAVGSMMTPFIFQTKLSLNVLMHLVFLFITVAGKGLVTGLFCILHYGNGWAVLLERQDLRLQCLIFSKLIHFILIAGCIKIFGNQRKEKCAVKEKVTVILETVFSILSLIMVVEIGYRQTGAGFFEQFCLAFLSFGILASYVLFCISVERGLIYKRREREEQLLRIQAEKIVEYEKKIENNRQEVFHLYHDLKKHFNTLTIISGGEEIKSYAETCLEKCRGVEGDFQTGNRVADMILYEEWKKTADMGIRVQFAVEKGSLSGIDLVDITTILGNALENAREACEKLVSASQEAYMLLKIKRQNNLVIMVISNKFLESPEWKDKNLVTSKKDGGMHGIGLKNIRSSVKKYHGDMKIMVKNDKYILTLMLKISNN